MFILRVSGCCLDSPDMGHDRTPLGVGTSVRLSVFFWVAVFFVPGPVTLSGPFEVGCPDTRTLTYRTHPEIAKQ